MRAYGRGGAGNMMEPTARPQPREQPRVPTVQAPPSALPQLDDVAYDSDNSISANNHGGEVVPDSAYRPVGRGGAGNYIEPRVLADTGAYSLSGNVDPATLDRSAGGLYQHRGRGGAGNFVVDEAAAVAEKRRLSAVEGAIARMVSRDVEMGLPRPEEAYLQGTRRRRSGGSPVSPGNEIGKALDPRVEAEILRCAV